MLCVSDQGGWLNETTVMYFAEYAEACFAAFGNEVCLTVPSCTTTTDTNTNSKHR